MSTTIYTELFCQFCKSPRKNKNSLHQHEIRCKENPNKIDTSFKLTDEQRKKSIIARSAINLQYCDYCKKECKNTNSLKAHTIRCKENPNKIDLSTNKKYNGSEKSNACRFCNLLFYKKDFNKHEILCDKNPNFEYAQEFYKDNSKRKPNQFTKALMLGLEQPIVSDETREKIGKISKQQIWTDERKSRHSLSMKNAVLKNPESYTKSNRGRVKHIKKYGMTFDGNWELKFYEWCLHKNIKVEDNIKFFEYTYNDNDHLYNPDFYLPDYDLYIEVKGYFDDKDIAKWNCFTEKLSVIKKDKINLIMKDKLSIEDIISDTY